MPPGILAGFGSRGSVLGSEHRAAEPIRSTEQDVDCTLVACRFSSVLRSGLAIQMVVGWPKDIHAVHPELRQI